MVIPLSRSVLGSEEAVALRNVLESGRLVQGPQVEAFERAVAARVARKHAIAVANGTVALTLALEALEIERGATVLVPDLTWPSPGHAVLGIGARPLLVDVDAHSWNVSAETAAAVRGEKTLRAAIVIDQFGCPADLSAISALFPELPLIADAACALGSIAADKQACGARGVIACLSFHPRKVVTTGEGGMCLTDDAQLAERLRILRNHGQHTPGQFTRASGNARMSELAAAVGCSQLQRLDEMLAARQQLAARYQAELPMLCPQRIPAGARPNYQTFGVVLPPHSARDTVISALRQREIEVGRLSYALHTLPQFAEAAAAAGSSGRLENSARLAERGLALPLYPGLTEAEQSHVIASLKAVLAL
jgi:perosamine synthetase